MSTHFILPLPFLALAQPGLGSAIGVGGEGTGTSPALPCLHCLPCLALARLLAFPACVAPWVAYPIPGPPPSHGGTHVSDIAPPTPIVVGCLSRPLPAMPVLCWFLSFSAHGWAAGSPAACCWTSMRVSWKPSKREREGQSLPPLLPSIGVDWSEFKFRVGEFQLVIFSCARIVKYSCCFVKFYFGSGVCNLQLWKGEPLSFTATWLFIYLFIHIYFWFAVMLL